LENVEIMEVSYLIILMVKNPVHKWLIPPAERKRRETLVEARLLNSVQKVEHKRGLDKEANLRR
jgi:hypothetical protein